MQQAGLPDENKSFKIQAGVYLKEVEILKVTDFSNYPNQEVPNKFESGYEPELCIKVVYQDGDTERKTNFMGWFQRKNKDRTGPIVGWSNYKNWMQWFLVKAKGDSINIDDENNYRVLESDVKACEGKFIKVISYMDFGRPWEDDQGNKKKFSYSLYPKVYRADEEDAKIVEEFENNRSLAKGYDELAAKTVEAESSQKKDGFEYGANTETTEKPADEEIF